MSHLSDTKCTYFEHCFKALGFAIRVMFCSVILAIHAFIPETFKTTASDTLSALLKEMKGIKSEESNES